MSVSKTMLTTRGLSYKDVCSDQRLISARQFIMKKKQKACDIWRYEGLGLILYESARVNYDNFFSIYLIKYFFETISFCLLALFDFTKLLLIIKIHKKSKGREENWKISMLLSMLYYIYIKAYYNFTLFSGIVRQRKPSG